MLMCFRFCGRFHVLANTRPSVVCLSVTFVRPTQPVETFGNFSRCLVLWPSVDIHGKFYRDLPSGTPPSGGLKAREVTKIPNIAIFDISVFRLYLANGARRSVSITL